GPGARPQGPAATRWRRRRCAAPLRHRLAGASPAKIDVHSRRRGRRSRFRRASGAIPARGAVGPAFHKRLVVDALRVGRYRTRAAVAPLYELDDFPDIESILTA